MIFEKKRHRKSKIMIHLLILHIIKDNNLLSKKYEKYSLLRICTSNFLIAMLPYFRLGKRDISIK
jgi:hypothetical protein